MMLPSFKSLFVVGFGLWLSVQWLALDAEALAGSEQAIFALRRLAPPAGGREQGTSPNWAGYVSTGKLFTAITGSWTVPSVSYVNYPNSPAKEDTSTWIGIGGNSDETLIQIGTGQEVSSAGETKYYAWYLLVKGLQNAAQPIPLAVSPGDRIEATITCVANCTPNSEQTWRMTIPDLLYF